MKEHPMFFSTPMVKAILDGKKTVTRRIVKPQPNVPSSCGIMRFRDGTFCVVGPDYPDNDSDKFKCKYSIGDLLWVRETWSHDAPDLETCKLCNQDALFSMSYGPYYKATEVSPDTLKWKPSIHMPRWASRITLEITDVKCERLQEITNKSAHAEGVIVDERSKHIPIQYSHDKEHWFDTSKKSFKNLWESINGKDSWSINPWVWVIEFKRIK